MYISISRSSMNPNIIFLSLESSKTIVPGRRGRQATATGIVDIADII